MVSCYYCERRLPWECICKKTREEKLISFFSSARREAKLCEDIIKGKIPEILVEGKKTRGEVKKIYTPRGFFFEIRSNSESCKETILLDSEGEPLYRHTAKGLGIIFGKKDSFDITWRIGGEVA